MSYLKDFLEQIKNRDYRKFLVLWEEYCTSDSVESEEFIQLLSAIKSSDFAKPFGQIVETALPLWKTIQDPNESYTTLRLLIDLETTNSPLLAEITLDTLKKRYGDDPKLDQRLRVLNLRTKGENFQGAISKYDLLAHMQKGHIVFHTGGWGTGEIIEVSLIREHLVIEFENVSGRKDLSFSNAFKTLIPLPPEHFLARRFTNPDQLESDAKNDPVGIIKLLLHNLGPKNASEIKDELCELVIPEKEWSKWWQGVRTKIKKDPLISSPDNLKDPFYLRKAELSLEERLQKSVQQKTDPNSLIQSTYSFVRDTPEALKNAETKKSLQDTLTQLLNSEELTNEQRLQVQLLLEQFFGFQFKEGGLAAEVKASQDIEQLVLNTDIIAFKKRILVLIKENRADWIKIFLSLLFKISQVQLKDYISKELNQEEKTRGQMQQKLKELLDNPSLSPDTFIWYFQKLVNQPEEKVPYQGQEGQSLFFESFLVLLSQLEAQPQNNKDIIKKIYNILSGKRYALVRQLLQGTSLDYTKEILLLASKCQTLSDHDIKILRSLAEVVHPSLASPKQRRGEHTSEDVIWTTEEGYLKTQDRIRQIGTVEMIENAREIEAARALGDLRENSEFKFAQERRARLQSELKTLSQQLNKARIITKDDIHFEEVGVGSVVDITDKKGKHIRYSILGPWDADPDQNILSFNSKFAQAMAGRKKGEEFKFRDEIFQIVDLKSMYG